MTALHHRHSTTALNDRIQWFSDRESQLIIGFAFNGIQWMMAFNYFLFNVSIYLRKIYRQIIDSQTCPVKYNRVCRSGVWRIMLFSTNLRAHMRTVPPILTVTWPSVVCLPGWRGPVTSGGTSNIVCVLRLFFPVIRDITIIDKVL